MSLPPCNCPPSLPCPTCWPHLVLFRDMQCCVLPQKTWVMLFPHLKGSLAFAPWTLLLMKVYCPLKSQGLFCKACPGSPSQNSNHSLSPPALPDTVWACVALKGSSSGSPAGAPPHGFWGPGLCSSRHLAGRQPWVGLLLTAGLIAESQPPELSPCPGFTADRLWVLGPSTSHSVPRFPHLLKGVTGLM